MRLSWITELDSKNTITISVGSCFILRGKAHEPTEAVITVTGFMITKGKDLCGCLRLA